MKNVLEKKNNTEGMSIFGISILVILSVPISLKGKCPLTPPPKKKIKYG